MEVERGARQSGNIKTTKYFPLSIPCRGEVNSLVLQKTLSQTPNKSVTLIYHGTKIAVALRK